MFQPTDEFKSNDPLPYFDEVSSADGWQGHATTKSIDMLKTEIIVALSNMGASVLSFKRGVFNSEFKRDGFQIAYIIDQGSSMLHGKIDIAALPVKEDLREATKLKQKEQSLKMALFNFKIAINGTRFLKVLCPGFIPLLP